MPVPDRIRKSEIKSAKFRSKYAVVIAAFNEELNIGPLTTRLIAALESIANIDWSLIYVIDGTDATRSIAQAFADDRPEITVIYNREATGLGNAFRQGFNAVPADTDAIITMDADLNHQPEELPRLVDALWSRDADIVIGSRKVSGSLVDGAPFWKTALSNFVNQVMRRILAMPVSDQTSGYRVYRKPSFDRISFANPGFAFLPEILIRAHAAGLTIVEEPIQFVFRTAGESKMKLVPTVRSYLAMIWARVRQSGHEPVQGRKPRTEIAPQ